MGMLSRGGGVDARPARRPLAQLAPLKSGNIENTANPPPDTRMRRISPRDLLPPAIGPRSLAQRAFLFDGNQSRSPASAPTSARHIRVRRAQTRWRPGQTGSKWVQVTTGGPIAVFLGDQFCANELASGHDDPPAGACRPLR
jgi:hypothetical protein